MGCVSCIVIFVLMHLSLGIGYILFGVVVVVVVAAVQIVTCCTGGVVWEWECVDWESVTPWLR
jgi:hypothetical protein